MSKALRVHVGETLEDFGERAISAWHRMERGEAVREKHVGFSDWDAMVRVLSPKRLELLRHLHGNPAKNIRALALALGWDYRRVHEDVAALAAAGLLERDRAGVRAEYDTLDARIRVAL